ncbi:MAG: adenylyltransferase/cytidyltransferase family protein [Lachnospiraceae bacterium]|nr:adenylyltransferase/cytidyltransferase family protein [Lachnospiraceae bacterium]
MKKILTFGVFDYFHIGHLRLFEQCKEHADYLIVALQDGEYILKSKPEASVLYSTKERYDMISALRIVDEVIIYKLIDEHVLDGIDFDILALGEDHVGERFDLMRYWCEQHGKRVVRLKRTVGISSSGIKAGISCSLENGNEKSSLN